MTTVLIIICVVFCIAVIFGIVAHLGVGIAEDKSWRERISRHHLRRRMRRRRASM